MRLSALFEDFCDYLKVEKDSGPENCDDLPFRFEVPGVRPARGKQPTVPPPGCPPSALADYPVDEPVEMAQNYDWVRN